MSLLKQSSTAQPLQFFMADTADPRLGKTGLSPTVTLRKVGGSFASPAGAVSEIAHGWYQVAGHATDTNTLGPLLLHAESAGADPTDAKFDVVAFDPQAATNLGLSALPTANAGAASGVAIVGSQMALTSGQVTALVAVIEAEIADDATGAAVKQAIVNKLLENLPDIDDLTLAAIASSVWANGTRTLTAGTNIQLPSNGLANVTTWSVAITGNVTGSLSGSVGSVGDKTGFKLAADGLDSVSTTAASGVAGNFREMVVQTWRRWFKKATKTKGNPASLKTYADDGTTVLTTQTLTVSASTETQGAAS